MQGVHAGVSPVFLGCGACFRDEFRPDQVPVWAKVLPGDLFVGGPFNRHGKFHRHRALAQRPVGHIRRVGTDGAGELGCRAAPFELKVFAKVHSG